LPENIGIQDERREGGWEIRKVSQSSEEVKGDRFKRMVRCRKVERRNLARKKNDQCKTVRNWMGGTGSEPDSKKIILSMVDCPSIERRPWESLKLGGSRDKGEEHGNLRQEHVQDQENGPAPYVVAGAAAR